MSADGSLIRILVVDDHSLVREGIATFIGGQSDMKLVAEASNGREAIQQFRPYRCTLTSLPCRLFEPLAEGSLAGQQLHLFCLHPTTRTIHSVQLDHHRHPILAPGQITPLPLIDLADVMHPLPTSPSTNL